MSVVGTNTLGGQIKAGTMQTANVEVLVRALFNGKRLLPIAGRQVVSPDFDQLTAHEKLILKGLFLKAKLQA